jgi:hypothetical protein
MDWLSDPTAWTALAALLAMAIVPGVDNRIFISIFASKLPAEPQDKARRIGLLAVSSIATRGHDQPSAGDGDRDRRGSRRDARGIGADLPVRQPPPLGEGARPRVLVADRHDAHPRGLRPEDPEGLRVREHSLSVFVELLNIGARRKSKAQPLQLHEKMRGT